MSFLRNHFGDPIELLLRLILGGAFLLAGTLKAIDPLGFITTVRAYEIIRDPWTGVVALGLPWLEIFCGAAIVLRVLFPGALVLTCGMLVVFFGSVVSAWVRGINIECGCFGDKIPTESYGVTVMIEICLLLIGVGLLWAERARNRAI